MYEQMNNEIEYSMYTKDIINTLNEYLKDNRFQKNGSHDEREIFKQDQQDIEAIIKAVRMEANTEEKSVKVSWIYDEFIKDKDRENTVQTFLENYRFEEKYNTHFSNNLETIHQEYERVDR